MIVRRHREYRVNMGRYEHVVFGMDLTINNDTDFPGYSPEALVEKADDLIVTALTDDIRSAALDTEEADSFIHLHPLNQPKTRKQ